MSTVTRNPTDIPFASSSVWNIGIGSDARWSPSTDADARQLHGLRGGVTTSAWGQPIYFGTASDPLVKVTNSDTLYPVAPQYIHIPISALPAAGSGGYTDAHMAFYDATQPGKMWSYWGASFNNGHDVTGGISTGLGGVWDTTGDGISNPAGSNQGDYNFAVGVITDYDVAQGAINHMVRLAISCDALKSPGATWTDNIPWPNSHEDYYGPQLYTGNIVAGSTFGIPMSVNLNSLGLSQGGMMLAKALQNYGGVWRDSTGTNQVNFYSTPENQNNPLIQQMQADMAKIVPMMEVLRNQGPNSVNGGGTPVVPKLPPVSLGGGTTTPPVNLPPTPIILPPTPIIFGTGPDSIVFQISEDAYANGDGTSNAKGDARFTVSVDGKQIGGTFTAAASHAAGQEQAVTLNGDFGPGTHSVAVNFLNDAWGGSASTDRNLYVDAVTYNGLNTNQSAFISGPAAGVFTIGHGTSVPPPTPSPAPSQPPPPITFGSGPDSLVLRVSEDAYANGAGTGDAMFTVSVDGKQLGGTFTATASHAAGLEQTVTLGGDFGPGTHSVSVSYINDFWGGTPSTDRNLYVDSVTYNGVNTNQSAYFAGVGTGVFTIGDGASAPTPTPSPTPSQLPTPITFGSGPDSLILQVSEDAYANGDGTSDAMFTVSIDGTRIGGTFTVTASHAAGQKQSITLNGDFGPGTHDVSVSYLNDACGGTPSADRNLYVDSITYNGFATVGTGVFTISDGTSVPPPMSTAPPPPTPITFGSGPDSLVLQVSEDAYANGDAISNAKGDAVFSVCIDGKQIGGTFTAAASHAAGQEQAVTLSGDFGPGTHHVSVNFLNDACGGTPSTDRNLYVDSVTYNGPSTGQAGSLAGAGTQVSTVIVDLTASGVSSMVLGSAADRINFIGSSGVAATTGCVQSTAVDDAGANTISGGNDSFGATGGSGFDLHDLFLAMGNNLAIDQSPLNASRNLSDEHGATIFPFGVNADSFDLSAVRGHWMSGPDFL